MEEKKIKASPHPQKVLTRLIFVGIKSILSMPYVIKFDMSANISSFTPKVDGFTPIVGYMERSRNE